MRASLVAACICMACIAASARPVDPVTAQRVAERFLLTDTRAGLSHTAGDITLTLIHQERGRRIPGTGGPAGPVLYHVFGFDGNRGFVLVAGDDVVRPILGWSDEGRFDPDDLPPALATWLDGCAAIIREATRRGGEPAAAVRDAWAFYTTPGTSLLRRASQAPAAGPLLTTTWDQQPYYNDQCPGGSVTGCVATAMAQILRFWNHPAKGAGIHSYREATYGTLTANFGATSYSWAAMPTALSAPNQQVAQLMFHCGVAVEMKYSPDGSAANTIDDGTGGPSAQGAYSRYFGYNGATIKGVWREDYSTESWMAMLRAEIDAGRPMQYRGAGPGGGHSWVCDGYDGTGNFHMNWGWSGKGNGWYSLEDLDPTELGTGGGNGAFNASQGAVVGIAPVGGGTPTDAPIILNAAIQITPNPIRFATAFSVHTDFMNTGTTPFSGDFCTALFSSDGTFISFVEIFSTGTNPLLAGNHYINGLTFSNAGLLAVPGQYTIGAYFRPTNGEWQLAGSTTHTNPVSVTIQGPTNTMQLSAAISPTPAAFHQGAAAAVTVNIINRGFITYYGQYAAALYDLDGNFVELIGTLDETRGLPVGYQYLTPFLSFASTSISAGPGTYLLAILEKPSGGTDYHLVGAADFPNPVLITVSEAGLAPDIYENNNTEPTSAPLPIAWNGASGIVVTNGANNHTGSDIDFYAIHLDPGARYTIRARVHDAGSSTDGVVYTNDVVFAINAMGQWSNAIDAIAPEFEVEVGSASQGRDIIIIVAPYFAGFTGTYKLDVRITKSSISDVETAEPQSFACTLHPNPVHDALTVNLTGATQAAAEWSIVDALGRTCSSGSLPSHAPEPIDVRALPPGMYRLLLRSGAVQRALPFVRNQ